MRSPQKGVRRNKENVPPEAFNRAKPTANVGVAKSTQRAGPNLRSRKQMDSGAGFNAAFQTHLDALKAHQPALSDSYYSIKDWSCTLSRTETMRMRLQQRGSYTEIPLKCAAACEGANPRTGEYEVGKKLARYKTCHKASPCKLGRGTMEALLAVGASMCWPLKAQSAQNVQPGKIIIYKLYRWYAANVTTHI